MIIHANFAKGYRGGERQTQLLIEELAKAGYAQKLLVRPNSELGHRCQGIKNLSVTEIGKPYAFHIGAIRGAQLLHIHETKAAQFAFFAWLFYKTPYIVTRRVDNRIKDNFFNRLIYTKAIKTIALSKAIEKEILRVIPKASTTIIPSAFSALMIDNNNVASLKKRFEGKFIVGNIGALDNAHKGQFYLVEAAKKLSKSHPEIHFILLGSGIDEQNYKKQAKDLHNITFEGFVDNVGDYINCFDLFVFPSLHEGLGSILFDVMRSRVPIIATDVGGIPDIIKHDRNGLLIQAKDSDAITDAIVTLKNDPKSAERLSSQALTDVQEYSPEKMAERYLTLYKEIL